MAEGSRRIASWRMGGAYKTPGMWNAVEKIRTKKGGNYAAWRAVLYQLESETFPHMGPLEPELPTNSHDRVVRLIRAGVPEEYLFATITLLLETGK